MTGQIPKYGKDFKRVSVPRDFERGLAHTLYELKANPQWHIRADGNSEQWWVFFITIHGREVWFPKTFSVMRDAMTACIGANLLLTESK